MNSRRLVVAVTGSSAPQLGYALLSTLRDRNDIEVHLVVSRGARETIQQEMGLRVEDFEELAEKSYSASDLAAAISSGSYKTCGMVIMPCSMRTLAAIATGQSGDLVTRAADVCLKERRRLVLVPRETPLNLIHIRNMETVTMAGAVVLPPVPAFYHKPQTIEDLLTHIVGKVLDLFEIEHELFRRWS